MEVTGQVSFTSEFFQPFGRFRVHLQYPNNKAELQMTVSNPRGWWQFKDLNFLWYPPVEPAQAVPSPAAAAATASPTRTGR
jgi:hypothetical protein